MHTHTTVAAVNALALSLPSWPPPPPKPQAYHPLCARRAGLHMEMAEPAVPNGPLQLITFCPRHCKPRPGTSGGCFSTGHRGVIGLFQPAHQVPGCLKGCMMGGSLDQHDSKGSCYQPVLDFPSASAAAAAAAAKGRAAREYLPPSENGRHPPPLLYPLPPPNSLQASPWCTRRTRCASVPFYHSRPCISPTHPTHRCYHRSTRACTHKATLSDPPSRPSPPSPPPHTSPPPPTPRHHHGA
jgi:hypothetical protein